MAPTKKSRKKISPVELDNVRIGYQATLSLATEVISIIWSIFNAMLVANSVVVAGLSFVLINQGSSFYLKTFLAIIGLIICLSWFLIAKRHRDYLGYYILSARELEEKFLGSNVKTLSRGGIYSNGKTVKLTINDAEINLRMSFWSRIVKGEIASYAIILVFVAIYVGVLFT